MYPLTLSNAAKLLIFLHLDNRTPISNPKSPFHCSIQFFPQIYLIHRSTTLYHHLKTITGFPSDQKHPRTPKS